MYVTHEHFGLRLPTYQHTHINVRHVSSELCIIATAHVHTNYDYEPTIYMSHDSHICESRTVYMSHEPRTVCADVCLLINTNTHKFTLYESRTVLYDPRTVCACVCLLIYTKTRTDIVRVTNFVYKLQTACAYVYLLTYKIYIYIHIMSVGAPNSTYESFSHFLLFSFSFFSPLSPSLSRSLSLSLALSLSL